LRATDGTGLYLTVVALLGVSLGFIIRSTAGGIAALFGILLVLPGNMAEQHRAVPAQQRRRRPLRLAPRIGIPGSLDRLRHLLPLRRGSVGRRRDRAQAPRRLNRLVRSANNRDAQPWLDKPDRRPQQIV